jgi:hypothetical protein
MTRHHRKPKKLGGNSSKRNISYVPRFKHEAWGILFDSFPAHVILERLRFFYELFGIDFKKSLAQAERDSEWISTRESMRRRRRAWDILFYRMNIYEILDEINRVWLDPDYKLVIRSERANKITIGLE